MTAAIVALIALLFVLPALAWWVGARDFWSRPGRRTEPDLFRALVRRHALRPAEIAQVEGAVTWGRELREPRLRAAVVDWSESYQRLAAERSARHPRVRRVGAALLLVGGVLALFALVSELADGRWQVLQGLLWPLVLLPVQVRLARGPRRAIERNRDPVEEAAATE